MEQEEKVWVRSWKNLSAVSAGPATRRGPSAVNMSQWDDGSVTLTEFDCNPEKCPNSAACTIWEEGQRAGRERGNYGKENVGLCHIRFCDLQKRGLVVQYQWKRGASDRL